MATDDDIERLKVAENRAKARLGYVEKQYKELRDESRDGSSRELEARDERLGNLASERTNLQIRADVAEAQRHEFERGRDHAARQAGAAPRSDAPQLAGNDAQALRERTNTGPEQRSPQQGSAALADAPRDGNAAPPLTPEGERRQHEQDQTSPEVSQRAGGNSGPDVSAGSNPTTSPGGRADKGAPTSNLEPFEPPAPEGYFIGHSRPREERFFKPVDDVGRMKLEAEVNQRYLEEASQAKADMEWQRQRAEEELKKLGLDDEATKKFRLNERAHETAQMNTLHQQQQDHREQLYAQTQVADESLRAEQNQKREDAERKFDWHWFDETKDLCRGAARQERDDKNTQQITAQLSAYEAVLDQRGLSAEEKVKALQNQEHILKEHHATALANSDKALEQRAAELQEQDYPKIVENGRQFTPSLEVPTQQRQGPDGP